ncbi:MAG: putative kinase/ribosomal protein S18 acetylase RimI-like enzyme [Myxococcota bacterium]|jgi:predicted kinase/ribosomal protein S18 acetylase RimI-like enzyme
MAQLHLIIGPVGSGKSTFARGLARDQRAVRLTLDAWMTRLYGDDPRPPDRIAWYLVRVDRCLAQIWEVARSVAERGTPVVLELGLIRRADRAAFYERVDAAGLSLAVVLVDAPREVRRERVARRNLERGETFSVDVPPAFFELASDAWEPPDDAEVRERRIVLAGAAVSRPQVAIRRATLADLPALVALNPWVHDLHVARAPDCYRPTDPAALDDWFAGRLGAEGVEIWLVDGLGYIVLELRVRAGTGFSHPSRKLRVDQVAVHGDARRRGIGRALMAHADARAQALGCSHVSLEVAGFNADALAFYAALGFVADEHRLARRVG